MIFLYQLLLSLLRLVSPLLTFGDSKLARGMAGRRHAAELLVTWGRAVRDPARPVVWIHAPSVGEGLQARAVKDALLELHPEAQVVYTFFSPSAEAFALDFGADVAAYLPWDLRGPLTRVLEAATPDLLIFTKTEVWPVLTREARRKSIPVAMVGATVPDGAGRMTWPAKQLLGSTWNALGLACASAEADARRLEELGVAAGRVVVTGDPGIDSAAARYDAAPREAPYLVPFRKDLRPTVVAGSTWGADEDVLLPAVERVRDAVPSLRLVVAPHEPTPEHVRSLQRRFADAEWTVATLSAVELEKDVQGVDVVVVDRVGVLAHLYGVADVSFVGGGFHSAGLHSVLEPAAAGTPVVFGPGHTNARAAADLLEAGGGKVAVDADALAGVLLRWLTDVDARQSSGQAAADYIQRHRGAARRTAEHLGHLLSTSA